MAYATFSTITVRQYQQLLAISTGDHDDKDMQLVAVITGQTLAQVEDMRLDHFNKCCRDIVEIFSCRPDEKPVRSIRLRGQRYRIIYNPRQLSPGRYIEVQEWLKRGPLDNMHMIMASIITPVSWLGRKTTGKLSHPELSEAILDMPFIVVHSACVFFCKLWKLSIKALADSLVKDKKSKMTEAEKMIVKKLLQTASDGFTT